MMTIASGHLVEDYLDRLEAELRDLPRARRRELVQEIGEHIAAARADLEPGDEAGLRTVLDQLGDPADIAAEARERFGVQPRRGGTLEVVALVLVLLGGVFPVPVLGWLAGVALLWASSAWTVRDKLIGTLVPPGGLASVFLVYVLAGSVRHCDTRVIDPATHKTVLTCTGGSSPEGLLLTALLIVLTIAPFVTTVYLARRMRSRRSGA